MSTDSPANNRRLPQVILLLTRSTYGTHVYTEETTEGKKQTFPTIYVKKHKLPDPPPNRIKVTVDYDVGDCK